jgi:hypothetical protein
MECKIKGFFLGWFLLWACCACTRYIYPALVALASPVQNNFSSPHNFSLDVTPSPGQAVDRVACLLICVYGSVILNSE